jgi:hypothetical protein
LTAAAYFDRSTDDEREVRRLADSLYRRVDWHWAQNGEATVSHGWKPETGFLRQALILYVLGLGSPTHPLPRKSYEAWTSTYRWKNAVRLRISLRLRVVHASALASVD